MYLFLSLLSDKLRTVAVLSLICLTTLLAGNALATDWYVSATNGDDTNNGQSDASPYRTIQKAANMAVAGDVIMIGPGEYREQVAFMADGVTFQPITPGTVTLNGTEVLAGWQLEAGTTYKTTAMDWNVDPTFGTNQLFQDRTMIELLRWPKQTSSDIIKPTTAIAQDVAPKGADYFFTLIDDQLTEITDNRWVGAKAWINLSRPGTDGQGYTSEVVSISGNTITFKYIVEDIYRGEGVPYSIGAGTEYFLYDPTPEGIAIAGGINNMLGAGEWWKHPDGTLYVKTRDGGQPQASGSVNVIEAKKRHFGFWSATYPVKSDYTIRGLKFFACSFTTVPDAALYSSFQANQGVGYPTYPTGVSNVLLDDLDFTYPSHQMEMAGNWQMQFMRWTGVALLGKSCTIQNSKIRYSATSALSVLGEDIHVLNNDIESTNYMSANSGAINTGHYLRDSEIGYNRISNTSSIAIYFQGMRNSDANNRVSRIHHNTISDFLRRSWDSGAIDEAGQDGYWLRIDHNKIFNTLPDAIGGVARAGVYFDFPSSSAPSNRRYGRFTVDHNLIYNVSQGILLNHVTQVHMVNNVMLIDVANGEKHTIEGSSSETYKGEGIKIVNNILSHPPNRIPGDERGQFDGGEMHNNITNATGSVLTSLFVDPLNPNIAARNYDLKDGSPAIDKGVVLGDYDEGIIEEPDLGWKEKGSDGSGPDTTPPSQPAEPTAFNVEENRFTLTWPATADVGGGVAYYELSTPSGSPQLFTLYPEVPTIDIKGLVRSTNYTFNLVAVDGMGNRSTLRTFTTRSGDRIAVVTIPKTRATPSINGIREAGVYTGPVSAIATLGEGTAPTSDADFSANWVASWDDSNLYVHVAVKDDVTKTDSQNWYSDDNVEIFINGNGDRPSSWGATDYQFYIRPGATAISEFQHRPAVPAGVEASAPIESGTANYNVEVKIPFTALGILSPDELQFIGIEVNVGDDDGLNGTSTSRKMVWKNVAYQNPSRFSVAQLTGSTPTDRTDPVNSGVVTAKGNHDGWVERLAFDNSKDTKWLHKDNTSWIEFKFNEDGSAKYAVSKYSIASANDVPGRDPKDWKLYGTNAANPGPNDFVEVDSRTGVNFADRRQRQEFAVSNNTVEYSTYRLEITANNGAPWIQLSEIELFAPPQLIPVTGIALTPLSDTIEVGEELSLTSTISPATANPRVTWSSSDTSIATVQLSGLSTAVVTAVAPGTVTITARSKQDSTKIALATVKVIPVVITDRTNPVGSGVVTAKGKDDGTLERNAFDNSTDTKWLHKATKSWIEFKFSEDGLVRYAVSKYSITSANDVAGRDPKDWKLYGTNVANPVFPQDFTEVDSRTGVTFDDRRQKQTFTVSNNTTEYSTYRLDITANNGASAIQLAEIELFAPPSQPGVIIATSKATVAIDEQQSLTASVVPSTASQELTWSSDNISVATVNSRGEVTGVALGTATITATSVADNTQSATAIITVVLPDRTNPVNSGVVTAKGFDDELAPRNAFDNSKDTKWLHKANTSWIEFKFSEDGLVRYAVSKYSITSANDVAGRDPKDWKLYGTNVANPVFPQDFTEVDSQAGVTFASRFERQEFVISNNTTEYSTYRLEIAANMGEPWIQLSEIELFAPPAKAGTVVLEYWSNIAGTSVSDIPLNTTPTSTSILTSLESKASGDNFGVRIRGYIVPTTTANYYFYIASDDNGEFWLSSDDQPSNKGTAPIAKVTTWTGVREWQVDWQTSDFAANQKSEVQSLQAGNKYYFEALMKEGYVADNLAIGWTTATDNTGITVIGSANLYPYEENCSTCRTASAEVTSKLPKEALTLKLHPNPASREVTIDLSGFEGESAVQVTMSDVTSRPFVSQQVQLTTGVNQVTLPVNHLPQGLFFVTVQGSKTTKTAKLVITK
jgi:uncharacterized protein YjdB